MRIFFVVSTILALALTVPVIGHAQDDDIDTLRVAVEELRADYDARIAELERRLAVAEQNAAQANYAAQQPAMAAAPAASSGAAAFNPAIGVVFQGQFRGFEGAGREGEEGLFLGETELVIKGNVDDKFAAKLTAALAFEGGESALGIEEAWVETTALPAGFGARMGRLASGIGYLNEKHSHQWDFADQPLPYRAFMGGRYIDNGVQLRWLAPTDLYVELGGELLQGEGDPSGLDSRSMFANIGGDIGTSSSWMAGGSYLEIDDMTSLSVAHAIWKWAPQGNWKQQNFIFQTEYFERRETSNETGWYAQAVFQPVQRWRFGLRADGLQLEASDPRRYTVMMDWSNSEFSRLRLQFGREDDGTDTGNEWGLQYVHSIGAHGAHSF